MMPATITLSRLLRPALATTTAGWAITLMPAPWPGLSANAALQPFAIRSIARVNAPVLSPVAVAGVDPTLIGSTAVVHSPTITAEHGAGAISPARIESAAAVGPPSVSALAGIVPAVIASTAFVGMPTIAPDPVASNELTFTGEPLTFAGEPLTYGTQA